MTSKNEPVDMFGNPVMEAVEPTPKPRKKRSNYRERQAERIAQGVHPLQGDPLLPEPGHTCGDCAHRFKADWMAGSASKCDRLPTHSATSDVKVRWPACIHWEAK